MKLPPDSGCAYAAEEFQAGVTLKGGEATGALGGFINTASTVLEDVDRDGIRDGLVNLVCSSGAAGTSNILVEVRGSDRKVFEVTYSKDAERVLRGLSVYRIYEMSASGAVLTLLTSGHTSEDATCCPSEAARVRYDFGPRGLQFKDAILGTGDPRALPPVGHTLRIGSEVRAVLERAKVPIEAGECMTLAVLGGRLASGDVDVIKTFDASTCHGADSLSDFYKVRGNRLVATAEYCDCEMKSSNWDALNKPYRYGHVDVFDITPADETYQLVPSSSF